MDLSRRQMLTAAGVAGVAGAAGLAGAAGSASSFAGPPRLGRGGSRPARVAGVSADPASALPAPADSGIDHVVVVMMENRSFDHFLGWVPGADGRQAGLTFRDRYGQLHPTHHLTAFNSCGFEDPDHSFEGGRIQLNGGRCDGWLRSGENDELAIGYYEQADLGFLGRAAVDWTTCDRYFSAVMAETYPNRFYQHAARTDRLHNNTDQSTLTTIWDRLADKGVDGRYYFGDVAFTLLWYGKYAPISFHFATFLTDCAAGTLPAVSFVDPRFEDEASGTSNDDHPHADIRAGEAFLNQVYDAIRTSPAWERTLLVINYDEWGGFFDHVAPTRAPDVSHKTSLRGFRVPALVISPLARRGHVASHVYDHTSVLRTIEWRWGLEPLTPRDAQARNIAEVLDFESGPDLRAPAYVVPPVVPVPCGEQESAHEAAEWGELKEIGHRLGWGVAT